MNVGQTFSRMSTVKGWMKAPFFASMALLFGTTLAFISFNAGAYERVVVNGKLFACQHSCKVTTQRDGSVWVTDTEFGWVAQIATNGEVIIIEP